MKKQAWNYKSIIVPKSTGLVSGLVLKGVDFKKVMLHSVGNTDIPEQIDSFETYMFDYVKGGTLWKDLGWQDITHFSFSTVIGLFFDFVKIYEDTVGYSKDFYPNEPYVVSIVTVLQCLDFLKKHYEAEGNLDGIHLSDTLGVSFPNIPFEEEGCCLGTNMYNLVKVMTLEYFFPEYSPENVEIPESFDIGTVSTKEFLSDISVLKLFSENSIPIPYSNRNIFDRLYDITNE